MRVISILTKLMTQDKYASKVTNYSSHRF